MTARYAALLTFPSLHDGPLPLLLKEEREIKDTLHALAAAWRAWMTWSASRPMSSWRWSKRQAKVPTP